MIKIALLFALVFISACQLNPAEEEKFANPLFYKTLYPRSNSCRDWIVDLTPNKITNTNIKTNEAIEQECILKENTQNLVRLSCDDPYVSSNREGIACEIIPEEEKPYPPSKTYVRCKISDQKWNKDYDTKENEFFSSCSYYIEPD